MPLSPMYARAQPTAESQIRLQSGKVERTINGDASLYTMGESINSLKQLIMIPKTSGGGSVIANTVGQILCMPWFYSPKVTYGTGPAPTANPREAFSFGGAIASCYVFVRGSTDVHAYSNDSGTNTSLMWVSQTPVAGNGTTTQNNPNNRSGCNVPRVWSPVGSSLHVRLPLYSRFVRLFSDCLNSVNWSASLTTGNSNPSWNWQDTTAPQQVGKLFVQNVGTTTTPVFLNRSAGDDAMCGHFIGPPPLLLLSSGSGTSWDPDSVGFN